ncbi:hypothetical protein C8J56DRAFT_141076 [Mycena floridula]|nr:hypothetical protein C8J56DRAFT_141076 [Mycena floridula]
MAYPQTMSPQAPYRDIAISSGSPTQRQRPPQASKQRFITDLSQCLFDFVIQLLPTAEEMAVKEDVRKLLERLIRTIEPDSRLLSFGSTANGFSLRNSDMDLCCLIDSDERLAAGDLVTMLGDLLERETKFHVKPLPHARIPIVKLSLDPSPGLPLGIACDIGFENRLALENTRLLMCYAMIDPTRVRTMVLFLKVWSKRRKINSPYKGTLSSYGYVLLVIYFLVHVKNPPVLPNLQQMPPLRPISKEDTEINGHNVWFFDDIDLLRQRWHSENTDTVAELLIDFFRYYSKDFLYNTGVASIRAGLLKKESKGWQNDLSSHRYHDARERNRLCIEDPFETDFNVSRCVTKDGLYTIRGEFMRAARILIARPERAIMALAELCEERKDEELVSAPSYNGTRLSHIPPQTPYTVGSQPMRPKKAQATERFSPPTKFYEPGPRLAAVAQVSPRPPPEHMAPRRGKWTSPPPPEAPAAAHTLFENRLGMGLELATASTAAREAEEAYASSSSNSEIITDDDRSDAGASDDVRSVQSFTEGSTTNFRRPPSCLMHQGTLRLAPVQVDLTTIHSSSTTPSPRGRVNSRDIPSDGLHTPSSRSDFSKRSISGPPRSLTSHPRPSKTPVAEFVPLPPSPESPSHFSESTTVYYQTAARAGRLYPNSGSHHSTQLAQYQLAQHQYLMSSAISHDLYHFDSYQEHSTVDGATSSSRLGPQHSHSQSTTTVTAGPTPPSHLQNFPQNNVINSSLSSSKFSHSRSRSDERDSLSAADGMSPPASVSTGGSSPALSSTGYATSASRSPSPPPPPTAVPLPRQKELQEASLLALEDFAVAVEPPTPEAR